MIFDNNVIDILVIGDYIPLATLLFGNNESGGGARRVVGLDMAGIEKLLELAFNFLIFKRIQVVRRGIRKRNTRNELIECSIGR